MLFQDVCCLFTRILHTGFWLTSISRLCHMSQARRGERGRESNGYEKKNDVRGRKLKRNICVYIRKKGRKRKESLIGLTTVSVFSFASVLFLFCLCFYEQGIRLNEVIINKKRLVNWNKSKRQHQIPKIKNQINLTKIIERFCFSFIRIV